MQCGAIHTIVCFMTFNLWNFQSCSFRQRWGLDKLWICLSSALILHSVNPVLCRSYQHFCQWKLKEIDMKGFQIVEWEICSDYKKKICVQFVHSKITVKVQMFPGAGSGCSWGPSQINSGLLVDLPLQKFQESMMFLFTLCFPVFTVSWNESNQEIYNKDKEGDGSYYF